MPNRILREGIITSEPVNALGWAEEVFYRRLLSVVDDFGRYHGNPSLLRAACYPLQLNKVSDSDVVKWLAETQKAGLVRAYDVDGKRFVEVVKFCQQVRAKASKFPHPPDTCLADATHVLSNSTADAHLDGDVVEVEDESRARRNGSRLPTDWQPNSELRRWAAQKRPDLDIGETVEKFRDYWLSKPGRAGTKLDWERTFRNWVREERAAARVNGSAAAQKPATCDYRGEPFDPNREPCGMAGAKRGSLYGGRPLCQHHQQALDAPLPKSAMPVDVRTALAGLVAKVTQ